MQALRDEAAGGPVHGLPGASASDRR
jgi:hypothetical protein